MYCHNPYFNRWFSAIRKQVFNQFNLSVTILILIDGFLQYDFNLSIDNDNIKVTILILIDGFLQYMFGYGFNHYKNCHNPYFNRWFSAITYKKVKANPIILSQSLF